MTTNPRQDATNDGAGYGVALSLGTAASAVCGFSTYEWLHPNGDESLLWAGCAGAAGLAAGALTIVATKRWRWMRRPLLPNFVPEYFVRLPRWFLALPAPSTQGAKKATEVKMEMPKNPPPPQTPGQIEREKRRKARDAEINQLFGEREAGARNASLGSGVANGFISNLEAVAMHLRTLVPSVKFDLTRMLDREADSATRISGAVSLGVKAAAAVVIGYFVYLEALQFRSAAYKAWAEACIEAQRNAINFSTLSQLESGTGPGRDLIKECAQ